MVTKNKSMQAAKGTERASKYGNKKTVWNGETFDSKKELKRWQDLKLLEKVGEITGLRRQVVYPIVINGIVICKYIADAVYEEKGEEIVEDTKSPITRRLPVYRLKKKLMKACWNIEISEV